MEVVVHERGATRDQAMEPKEPALITLGRLGVRREGAPAGSVSMPEGEVARKNSRRGGAGLDISSSAWASGLLSVVMIAASCLRQADRRRCA